MEEEVGGVEGDGAAAAGRYADACSRAHRLRAAQSTIGSRDRACGHVGGRCIEMEPRSKLTKLKTRRITKKL